MSEYFFSSGSGKIPAQLASRIDKIARQHGARFVSVTLPGEGPRFWFAGPNRGNPFDQRMANDVMADLATAGIDLWAAAAGKRSDVRRVVRGMRRY